MPTLITNRDTISEVMWEENTEQKSLGNAALIISDHAALLELQYNYSM